MKPCTCDDPPECEALIDLARALQPHAIIGIRGKNVSDRTIAEIALAVELAKRPAAFRLRAMVEGWDRQRLVREMF